LKKNFFVRRVRIHLSDMIQVRRQTQIFLLIILKLRYELDILITSRT